MSIFQASRSVWTGRMLSLLRIVAGILFIEHGTQKVFGWPPTTVMQVPVSLMSALGVAGLLEVFGGIAFTLGLSDATRRLCPCGRDGGRLLHCPLSTIVLPGEQWRRPGSAILFPLPVLYVRRCRPVELGREDRIVRSRSTPG